jgi:hypothetical protein
MKKLIFILALVILAAAACKDKKPAEFTRLGFYTPYQGYMEKLNGKVESVTEKAYWVIPEGDSLIKGPRVSKTQFDSVGYTYDYIVIFDSAGYPVTCTTINEIDRPINIWKLYKENGLLARAEFISDDTLRYTQKIICDDKGIPVIYEGYNAMTDTLVQKIEVHGSCINDTITVQYYNYKGEPGVKYVFNFDERALLTRLDTYRNGLQVASQPMTYTDKGFVEEFKSLDKDKNVTSSAVSSYSKYDEHGNWTKSYSRDAKGFTMLFERVYTYFE